MSEPPKETTACSSMDLWAVPGYSRLFVGNYTLRKHDVICHDMTVTVCFRANLNRCSDALVMCGSGDQRLGCIVVCTACEIRYLLHIAYIRHAGLMSYSCHSLFILMS